MPEKEILEDGKQPSAGDPGSSTPGASDGAQQLPEWAQRILSDLEETKALARGVQKGTDKQIRNQVNNSIERVLELAGKGLSKAQIERELWIDSQMAGNSEPVDNSPASDKGEGKEDTKAIFRVVDDLLGLPANDPRVTDLKLKHGSDFEAYKSEALKLYQTLSKGQGESTPGEHPVASGGGAAPKVDNPIKDIDDPRALYKLAAQEMAKSTGKKRRVPS